MQELIITTNRKNAKSALIFSLCFFLLIAYLTYKNFVPFFITIFSIGIFLACLSNLLNRRPLAIINDKGIWRRGYGLIPWTNISTIEEFSYGAPMSFIGIQVKDKFRLSRQASISGKMGVYWSRRFGYPPVIIANASIPRHEILDFAQSARSFLNN